MITWPGRGHMPSHLLEALTWTRANHKCLQGKLTPIEGKLSAVV